MDPARRNTKFGLLAFDGCAGVDLVGALALGDGVSVHPGCPIELPEHWITWLGSIQAERLTRANLVFTVQIESETPTILDAETDQLATHLQALRFGLFLHGIPEYRANLLALGGVGCESDTRVRHIEIPGLAYRHPFGYPPAITAESLAAGNYLAARAEATEGLGPAEVARITGMRESDISVARKPYTSARSGGFSSRHTWHGRTTPRGETSSVCACD